MDNNTKFYEEVENTLTDINIKTIIRQPAYIIVAVMLVIIAVLKITAPELVPMIIIIMGAMLFGFTLRLSKKY